MSVGAVVPVAKDSVMALAFLFAFLARTCMGFLQFPFLTINVPQGWAFVCVCLWLPGEMFTY